MSGHRLQTRTESGFTLVEVLVAMVLGLIVVTAVSLSFTAASGSSVAGERQVQLLSLAQQQLENVRQAAVRYGFQDLFMNAGPGAADTTIPTNPSNPNDYVSSGNYYVEENYNNNGGSLSGNVASGTPSAGEPLVIGTPSASTPGIAPLQGSVGAGGGGTATVYTYVTQVSDACNSGTTNNMGASGCNTTAAQQDVRRIIVAVAYNNASGQTPLAPEYATTIIANPVPSNQVNVANGIHLGVNIGAQVGVGS